MTNYEILFGDSDAVAEYIRSNVPCVNCPAAADGFDCKHFYPESSDCRDTLVAWLEYEHSTDDE